MDEIDVYTVAKAFVKAFEENLEVKKSDGGFNNL